MKKLAVNNEIVCMSCSACEVACSEAFYKTVDPRLSCVQIAEKNGTVRPKVCIQCGKCARTCESEAITQNAKGVYMINKSKCVNCGKCVEACPFGVLVKSPEREAPSKCIACGICAKACPMSLLYIKETEDVTAAAA
ncbi:MAG: 4Fe-4S binding protein [Oscillospiraceae bacterium]|jgi:Fe-S-cluster-containing hydrogenase component 2|nr:4Fe-4S binding protein [Oscillospiraceae bacterium]